jgi:hypothetical protein
MKLKHCITALLLVTAINCTPVIVHAECGGEGGELSGDPDSPCDPPTNVPFDNGVSILIAAGVAYGLKKKYDNSKLLAAE